MTLSGITALSSFTDKAPVSPTYMNAKFGEIQANFDTLAATAQSASDVTGRANPSALFYGHHEGRLNIVMGRKGET